MCPPQQERVQPAILCSSAHTFIDHTIPSQTKELEFLEGSSSH